MGGLRYGVGGEREGESEKGGATVRGGREDTMEIKVACGID